MYMKYRHEEQAGQLIEELCSKEEGIMRAEKAVNGISRTYIKAIRDMAIEKNRLDRGQARYEGREEGREEGLAEGREEGRAEGRAEGQAEAELKIARKMKAMGDSAEKIHTITGLPPETVEKL
jgi:flagellar biosynthesis/type III secretory pathway protein FliH